MHWHIEYLQERQEEIERKKERINKTETVIQMLSQPHYRGT